MMKFLVEFSNSEFGWLPSMVSKILHVFVWFMTP